MYKYANHVTQPGFSSQP